MKTDRGSVWIISSNFTILFNKWLIDTAGFSKSLREIPNIRLQLTPPRLP